MNFFLKKKFNRGVNRLGRGSDIKKDYPAYIIEDEKKTAEINKYGCQYDRWFLNWPTTKPSKTPKHKLYSYFVEPDLIKDRWTIDFNQQYFDGIFRDLLEIDKAYNQIPIIDITGYSRKNVLFPRRSLYDPKNYWFLRALTKKVIQEADKTFPPSKILKRRKYILQPFNESYAPFFTKKEVEGARNKKIIGRAHWIIWDEMRKNGLKISNLKINITNGLNVKGEVKYLRTRDMVFGYIGEYVDWDTGKSFEIMAEEKIPFAPVNKHGYKQKKFKPRRDMLIAIHGVGSLDGICKCWERIDKKGKKYIERISSAFYSALERNVVCDSDGFAMFDKIGKKIGLWKEALKFTCLEIWGKNILRGLKNGILFLSHPRGDTKNRIYKTVPGFPNQWTYHDEYWSAEANIKPMMDAFLELGFKKDWKDIPYKGIMEKKYKSIPEPEPEPGGEEIEIITEDEITNIILDEKKEEKVKDNFFAKLKKAWNGLGFWIEGIYLKSRLITVLSFFALLYVLIRLIFLIL